MGVVKRMHGAKRCEGTTLSLMKAKRQNLLKINLMLPHNGNTTFLIS